MAGTAPARPPRITDQQRGLLRVVADDHDGMAAGKQLGPGRCGQWFRGGEAKLLPDSHTDDDRPADVEFGADRGEAGGNGPQHRTVAVLGLDRIKWRLIADRSVVACLVVGP